MYTHDEPKENFRDVFKCFTEPETQRVIEVLGALELREEELGTWKESFWSGLPNRNVLATVVEDRFILDIGTYPTEPDRFFVSVTACHDPVMGEPKVVWMEGRVENDQLKMISGAICYKGRGHTMPVIPYEEGLLLKRKAKLRMQRNDHDKLIFPPLFDDATEENITEKFLEVAKHLIGVGK